MAFLLLTPVLAVEAVEVALVVTTVVTTTFVATKAVEKTAEVVTDVVNYLERDSSLSTNVSTTNTLTVSNVYEVRTIYDWWGNGLSGAERQKLLDLGYNERTERFGLRKLKDIIYNAEKAPGRPTKEDGFEPKKNWDGKTLERAPKSYHKKGYPDNKGRVWVPTGRNTENVKQHGNPHWDREYPDGTHDNVYPGGKVRPGTHKN